MQKIFRVSRSRAQSFVCVCGLPEINEICSLFGEIRNRDSSSFGRIERRLTGGPKYSDSGDHKCSKTARLQYDLGSRSNIGTEIETLTVEVETSERLTLRK